RLDEDVRRRAVAGVALPAERRRRTSPARGARVEVEAVVDLVERRRRRTLPRTRRRRAQPAQREPVPERPPPGRDGGEAAHQALAARSCGSTPPPSGACGPTKLATTVVRAATRDSASRSRASATSTCGVEAHPATRSLWGCRVADASCEVA